MPEITRGLDRQRNILKLFANYNIYYNDDVQHYSDVNYGSDSQQKTFGLLSPVAVRGVNSKTTSYPLILFCLLNYPDPHQAMVFLTNVLANSTEDANSLYQSIANSRTDIDLMGKLIQQANLRNSENQTNIKKIFRGFAGEHNEQSIRKRLQSQILAITNKQIKFNKKSTLELYGILQHERSFANLSYMQLFNAYGFKKLKLDKRYFCVSMYKSFADLFCQKEDFLPFGVDEAFERLRDGGVYNLINSYNQACSGFSKQIVLSVDDLNGRQ